MSRKEIAPRKRPSQQRSSATVQAILQATTHILEHDGYAKLTTNRIAEKAGVNIASLYQYFPNKEAIIGELQYRHVKEMRQATQEVLSDSAHSDDLLQILPALVRAATASHLVNPELHRVLTEEIPLSSRDNPLVNNLESLDLPFETLFVQAGFSPAKAKLRVWMMKTLLREIIHRALIEQPEALASGELEKELLAVVKACVEELSVPASRT